jgi:hypothetical protein
VLSAVQFYDHASLEAGEINDVVPNWLLPSELETVQLSCPQMSLKQPLCIG